MIVCRHGVQMRPQGESGIYFICQADWDKKGSHCRYARWCPNIQKYCDSTGSVACPKFERFIPEKKIENKTALSKPKSDEIKIERSSSSSTRKATSKKSTSETSESSDEEDDKKSSRKSSK